VPRLGITGMPPAMASSVSREPGSVAKTVAGTSVSKRYCNKKGGSKGPPSTSILSDLLTVFRMPKGKPTLTGPMKTQKSFRRACMTRRSTSASRECSGTLATNRRPTGPRRALTNFRTQRVAAVALFGTLVIPDVKARSARRRDRLGYVGRIAAGEMEEGAPPCSQSSPISLISRPHPRPRCRNQKARCAFHPPSRFPRILGRDSDRNLHRVSSAMFKISRFVIAYQRHHA
jgi:hypothetical protein